MTDPWDYMDYSPSHEVGEKMAFNEQGEMAVGKYSVYLHGSFGSGFAVSSPEKFP